MLLVQFINWLMIFTPQEALNVTVPDDIAIWGGLSLALIFRVAIVPALIALRIINDENKKTVGGYLIAAGALVAGIYSLATAKISDPMVLFTNLIAGGFAGIGAVGLYSTQKNLLEYFRGKKTQ